MFAMSLGQSSKQIRKGDFKELLKKIMNFEPPMFFRNWVGLIWKSEAVFILHITTVYQTYLKI